MGGLPQRFPKLRFHWAEAAALWVPYVVKDLKRRWGAQGKDFPDNPLKEYRQYVSCQTDDDVDYIFKYSGEDNLVIGTDYGHNDQSTRDRGAPESEGTRQHHRAPVREDHQSEPEGAVRAGVGDPPPSMALRPPLPLGEGRGEGATGQAVRWIQQGPGHTGTVGAGFKPARARPTAD